MVSFTSAAVLSVVAAQGFNSTAVATSTAVVSVLSCGPEVTDCPYKSEEAVVVTSTDLISVISCAPEVTNCPGRNSTAAPSKSVAPVESSPEAVVVTSTDLISVISCAPEVTNCPGRNHTGPATSALPATSAPPSNKTVAPTPAPTPCAECTTLVTVIEGKTVTIVGSETSAPAPVPEQTSAPVVVNAAGVAQFAAPVAALAFGAMLL